MAINYTVLHSVRYSKYRGTTRAPLLELVFSQRSARGSLPTAAMRSGGIVSLCPSTCPFALWIVFRPETDAVGSGAADGTSGASRPPRRRHSAGSTGYSAAFSIAGVSSCRLLTTPGASIVCSSEKEVISSLSAHSLICPSHEPVANTSPYGRHAIDVM